MPKRVKQKKRTSDENEIAFQLVQRSAQEQEPSPTLDTSAPATPSTISEYMAAIGRKGGQIGGKRRLKTMTAEDRHIIASKAAKARWRKKKTD